MTMNDILDCVCSDCVCPCATCPCVPICRHKTIKKLRDECILFNKYYDYPYFSYKEIRLVEVLNPTNWRKSHE